MMTMDYLIIAGSTACIYIFVVVALRLFGKTEIAQLSVVDLVFVLLISNAVQNAMVGSNTSLFGGICSAVTLFILNAVFKWLIYRLPKLSGYVQGQSLVLIYNGEVNRENLRKARISSDELNETLREHNVKSAAEVNLAVLERDGNISVLSDDYQTRRIKKKDEKKLNVHED
jgi:uncharacterized membrane protein YcaP (DUF421 family)